MSFELREMKTYCARLRGETNSKAMEISRMERTVLELLPYSSSVVRTRWGNVKFSMKVYWKGGTMKSINSRFFLTRVREMAGIPLLSCKKGGKEFAEVFVLRLYSRKGNRSDTSLPKFIEQKKRAAKKQSL